LKRIYRILSLILCLMLSLSFFTACKEKEAILTPDYSESKKEFDIWAYQATCNGWFQERGKDGILRRQEAPQYPVPVENEETIKTYKDAGFNTLFITYSHQFDGRDFENSDAKKLMDIAHAQGLKCFVFEIVTYQLSRTGETLINPQKADGKNFFNTQEELNAYVADVVKDVIKHPAFYGFSLRDEPSYVQMISIGQVYKAIQAAAPGCFCNMNMYPMPTKGHNIFVPGGQQMTAEVAYTKHLEHYLEVTGAKHVQYDDYPLGGTAEKPTVDGMHLAGLKLTAEFCRDNGLRFNKVFQTTAFEKAKGPICRKNTKTDMYWQLNLGMAFGIKNFSYWTYYPVINTAGEYYDVTASFLNRYGEKNEIYHWMSDIHPQMQKMAKALMNFEYQGMQIFNSENLPGVSAYAEYVQSTDTFKRLGEYTVDGEGTLVITELYDEGAGFYGYYLVNASDPTIDTTLSFELDFGTFNFAQTYRNGEVENQRTEKGKYANTLKTGEGVFVIPYK